MGIEVRCPGKDLLDLRHLVLDFTGTLSADGRLLPDVADRIVRLSRHLDIVVMTADTRGTALAELAPLPLTTRLVPDGATKARLVEELDPRHVVAIGNGCNDVAMVDRAVLGIAVLGAEGTAGALIRSADVVAPDIVTALDLLLHPQRLVATLRP